MKVSELGEIALLRDVVLKHVAQDGSDHGDDCAHLDLAGQEFLWSIDPCPTPVAKWLGFDSPEIYGWYTALINLSDIAASGGVPLGMLVSLEFPDSTSVEFVDGFQRGLRRALDLYNAKLYGGNLKSAPRFAATGTILGSVHGPNSLKRKIDTPNSVAYLIGPVGLFWASVAAYRMNDQAALSQQGDKLFNSLCFPEPQLHAGIALSQLPYRIACMDCSDGVLNAMHQMAIVNEVDLTLRENLPNKIPQDLAIILKRHNFSLENAFFQFGDWQLFCFVPQQHASHFEESMSTFSITRLGTTIAGTGRVLDGVGRSINPSMLNENFSGGYNSITSLDNLVDRFMCQPLFI